VFIDELMQDEGILRAGISPRPEPALPADRDPQPALLTPPAAQ
jgi:hypothetical protein